MANNSIRFGGVAGVLVVVAAAVYAVMRPHDGAAPAAGSNGAAPAAATAQTAPSPIPKPTDAAPVRRAEQPPAAVKPAAGVQGVASLRIGTWNIEWLGSPEKRSGLAMGTAQSPEDLADYIVAAGVDVLAVEEVVAGGQKPRSAVLDQVVAIISRRSGRTWKYALFPDRRGEQSQLTGVLWDSGRVRPVSVEGKPLEEAEPQAVALPQMRGTQTRLWNKPPYAVKFTAGPGKTDFVLIVVHMKADYNGDFALTREEEAKNLSAALPAVRKMFKDEDIVVLGDTNMTKAGEGVVGVLAGAGLEDLNRKNERTNWREGSMDRIFTPAGQPEFAQHVFEVMSDRYLDPKRWDARDFKKRLSDHYMVVSVIKVMDDDD